MCSGRGLQLKIGPRKAAHRGERRGSRLLVALCFLQGKGGKVVCGVQKKAKQKKKTVGRRGSGMLSCMHAAIKGKGWGQVCRE